LIRKKRKMKKKLKIMMAIKKKGLKNNCRRLKIRSKKLNKRRKKYNN
jgi:hypothetical protein